MKTLLTASLILIVFFSQQIFAASPTQTLEIAVDKILQVAGNKQATEEVKKNKLREVLLAAVDFEAVSKRVVSKSWNDANAKQQDEFKKLFLEIMVDTYAALLTNYSGEKVEMEQEQIKADKYAIVDSIIVSDNKRIPVRYRMINEGNGWKIYDFIPEGVSLVSTYKNNYTEILRNDGVAGLLTEMKLARAQNSKK